MRKDFCALILTNGRPDRVTTLPVLEKYGYTGPVFLVVDDEDKTLPEYRERYGERVVTFSKLEVAEWTDEGDNSGDRRTILHARNASFSIAERLGFRYFIQLDDDYNSWYYRFDGERQHGNWRAAPMDRLFDALVEFYEATPFLSIAFSQGGDWIGGGGSPFGRSIRTKRKAMNTFICDTERPFQFAGRFNEDVNTYTALQRRGGPFLTIGAIQVNQAATQSNAGGITEAYKDFGTYTKAFFSVMYAPSCVRISTLNDPRSEGGVRLHHMINWNATAPAILPERFRKARA